MTLRLRLVLALTGLLAVGLALFGFATYSLYARSEYQRLDDQISSSVALASRQLEGYESGQFGSDGSFGPGAGPNGGGPRVNLPPGTYAERRDATGKLVNYLQLVKGDARPDLPSTLVAAPGTKRYFTTGSHRGVGPVARAGRGRSRQRRHVGRRRRAAQRRDLRAQQPRAHRGRGVARPARDPERRIVADPAPRPAPARADGDHGRRDHRRRPDPAGEPVGRRDRGRPARPRAQHDARRHRGRVPRARRHRAAACASSWPTPPTSCARRSRRSRASPSCSGSGPTTPRSTCRRSCAASRRSRPACVCWSRTCSCWPASTRPARSRPSRSTWPCWPPTPAPTRSRPIATVP